MSNSVPESLRKAVRDRKIIPLIGAGVSMSVSKKGGGKLFPSWLGLLMLGEEELRRQNKKDHADIVKGMIALNRLQEAANFIQEGLKGSQWHNFLRDIFYIKKDDIDSNTLDLPRAILGLGNRLITLNFDKICEFSSDHPTDIISIDSSQASELANFSDINSKKQTIWHLHGKIDNISSVILSSANYEKLYAEDRVYKAAIDVLRNIFMSSNVLFIGCSLEDIELLSEIDRVCKIFDGNVGPHFALIHKDSSESIRNKIKEMPIEVVEFFDFGPPLLALINDIKSNVYCGTNYVDKNFNGLNFVKIVGPEKKPRAAILFADPLDKSFSNQEVISEINKLKINKEYFHLNLINLQRLENFDYIFIVTSLLKGRILIENDFMLGERIPLSLLLDNIGQDPIGGIFIFLNNSFFGEDDFNNDIVKSAFPIIAVPYFEKSVLSSIFFKIFKKKNLSDIKEIIFSNVKNIKEFDFSGDNDIVQIKTKLSDEIDPRSIRGFTGRITDISNISRSIFEKTGNDSVLTIKAAGGVGKTAIIQKIAFEISRRNLFSNGIEFIDCEFIANYKILERSIAKCFDLEFDSDFKLKLKDAGFRDILIILDNVETLLYLDDCNDIKELICFISEYAMIVVTSRESLGLENESIYELRRLTTDEALELFVSQLSGRKLSSEETKLIREKIVEDLLDNNPLAIKLITKTIPPGKNFQALVKDLEVDIFGDVSSLELHGLSGRSDRNVERKRSLYACINYSYTRLNEKEKLAFEILSLFPDGINLELFKKIAQDSKGASRRNSLRENIPNKQFLINDSLLKALESKSMIQANNGHIRLQSIVGKFAGQKLEGRESAEINRIYENFFNYLDSFSSFIMNLGSSNPGLRVKVFDAYQKNFLKGIVISKKFEAKPSEICWYLNVVLNLSFIICTPRLFINTLIESELNFDESPIEKMSLAITKICARYYSGDFDSALRDLYEVLPVKNMLSYSGDSDLERDAALSASCIYGMEGDALNAIIMFDRCRGDIHCYPDILLQVGCLYEDLIAVSDVGFFTLEAKLMLNTLSLGEVDKYISELHLKQHMEILQANYVRAKLVGKARSKISKFTTINPYTTGIKFLISAIEESDANKKITNFKNSLDYLKHIKYYYVEAILLFSRFLHSLDHDDFDLYFDTGLELSRLHNYRLLTFLFEKIKCDNNIVYDEKYYPLPVDYDYLKHIQSIRLRGLKRR